jgi:hypothetical protein
LEAGDLETEDLDFHKPVLAFWRSVGMVEAVLQAEKGCRVPNIDFWLKNRGGEAGKSCRMPAFQRVKSKFGALGAEVRY